MSKNHKNLNISLTYVDSVSIITYISICDLTIYPPTSYDNTAFLAPSCDDIIGTFCGSHIRDKPVCGSYFPKYEPQMTFDLILLLKKALN
jgi:hypothetical protein